MQDPVHIPPFCLSFTTKWKFEPDDDDGDDDDASRSSGEKEGDGPFVAMVEDG